MSNEPTFPPSVSPTLNRLLWASLILFYIAAFIQIDYWRKAAYGGDSWGYYVHLPATFIYQDIGDYSKSFEAVKQYDANLPDPKVDKYGVRPTPIGKFAVKYSHGLAVLFLPFFIVAHVFCKWTGLYPTDGFSMPYMLANGVAVLFYVFLGLFFLKKLLNCYFTEGVTWAIVFTLAVATNLFYFATYNSIMSHAPLFACYCFLLFTTDSFYRSPQKRWVVFVGIGFGLVALIRMNELYAVFIPLFWGVSGVQSLKERFVFFSKNFKKYIVWVVLPVFCLFLPQLLYWHFVSGQWIYNAYVGETFDFRHPQITEGVFGYKNGWLPWTPVMVFALLGLFFLKKYAKAAFLPTILILPLHIYIIYSWWCWYYINGFGSRPMVEMYALLAFSLGAFYSFLMRLKKLGAVLLAAIVLFFSGFNLFKIYQEKQGLIWTQFSNRAFYWEMLFANQPSRAGLTAWMSNESQPKDAVKIADMISQNFEDSTLQFVTTALKSEGQRSFESKETETGLLSIPLSKYNVQPNDYIAVRLQGFFHEKDRITTFYEQALLKVFFMDRGGKLLKDRYFRMQPFIGNPDFNIW
ncbi:MAG: hypothetical protein JNL70_21290, partial [Saprospiraceae bacterium]|nr:hypothetical protein [Saprospiraceae bacterium]